MKRYLQSSAVTLTIAGTLALIAASAASTSAVPDRQPVPTASKAATTTHCPRVVIERRPPSVEGGCALVATFERVDFEVLTVAGPGLLETCEMYYRLVFENDGRAWISKFGISSVAAGGRCGWTLMPCRWNGSGKPYPFRELIPWQGTVKRVASRRYDVELAACLDSPVGRFEGDLNLTLNRRGGRWWARAMHAPVGDSGLRIHGRWRLRSLEHWAKFRFATAFPEP